MSTDTPRPDRAPEGRILPTEPGWWHVIRHDEREIARVYLLEMGGRDPILTVATLGVRNGLPVKHAHAWGYEFIRRVPTPAELAAMDAKLAAGQALADALRRRDAAKRLTIADYFAAAVAVGDCESAILAAYPPEGGAR